MISFLESIRLFEQAIKTVADLDKGARLTFGRKMRPYETGDLVGLDASYGVLRAIYEESNNNRYFPQLIMRRKVMLGHLGRKMGKGWYEYNEDGSKNER